MGGNEGLYSLLETSGKYPSSKESAKQETIVQDIRLHITSFHSRPWHGNRLICNSDQDMTENDTAEDSTVKGIALYQLGQEKDNKLQHTTAHYMTEHIKTLRSDAFDGAV